MDLVSITLAFHTDCRNTWLEVPVSLLPALGIADKISETSKIDLSKGFVYLEETNDAILLIETLKQSAEYDVEYVDSHQVDGDHPIRLLKSFDVSQIPKPDSLLDVSIVAYLEVKESKRAYSTQIEKSMTVKAECVKDEISDFLNHELSRLKEYGFLKNKQLVGVRVGNICHNAPNGCYYDFPVPGLS